MTTPRPPSPFPASNTFVLKERTILHRVHDSGFGSCTFNLGLGRRSRFAPLHLPGGPIPTQYVATTFECAVNETIFHDVPLTAPGKTVGADNIKPLAHSVIQPLRILRLVPLFTPGLALEPLAHGTHRHRGGPISDDRAMGACRPSKSA